MSESIFSSKFEKKLKKGFKNLLETGEAIQPHRLLGMVIENAQPELAKILQKISESKEHSVASDASGLVVWIDKK